MNIFINKPQKTFSPHLLRTLQSSNNTQIKVVEHEKQRRAMNWQGAPGYLESS